MQKCVRCKVIQDAFCVLFRGKASKEILIYSSGLSFTARSI